MAPGVGLAKRCHTGSVALRLVTEVDTLARLLVEHAPTRERRDPPLSLLGWMRVRRVRGSALQALALPPDWFRAGLLPDGVLASWPLRHRTSGDPERTTLLALPGVGTREALRCADRVLAEMAAIHLDPGAGEGVVARLATAPLHGYDPRELADQAVPTLWHVSSEEEGPGRPLLRVAMNPVGDPLTGVLTVPAFRARAWERMGEAGAGVLAYMDLDHFKSFNDVFGYQVADRVLRLFADELVARFHPRGVVGRLGGQEFAVYLPGVDLEEARAELEALNVEFGNAPAGHWSPAACEGGEWREELRPTASVGLAAFPADGATVPALLEVADHCEYRAKLAGRARVVGPRDG